MPSLASRHHIRAERNRYRRAQNGQAWSVKTLPQFYYHTNFSKLIEAVGSEFDPLLDVAARDFMSEFHRLPFAAQCVYARMSGRKARVFNVDKFIYPEIENIEPQFDVLADAGFIGTVTDLDARDYFDSLTKPQLLTLLLAKLCPTEFKKSWSKDRLINIAVDKVTIEDLEIPPNIWIQSKIDELRYIFFLHSGQIENSLQSLALRDLGLIKSPKTEQQYGHNFDGLECAKTAFFYRVALRDFETDGVEKLQQTLADWPVPICPIGCRLKDKLLQKLGGVFERENDIASALNVYSQSDSAHCNERIIRLRYKNGEKDWVKTRLEEIIENPSSDDEHSFAQDFYARKYHKKRTSIVTDILRQAEHIKLDEAFKNQPEQAAMRHFQDKGLICFRTENTPWRNLFGLLFWDELFGIKHGTSGAKNPDSNFYKLNKKSIERKLADLDSPHLILVQLLKTLTAHHGTYQKIINWQSCDLEPIRALIDSSPNGALAKMLRLMAKDCENTKDGFPDLLVIKDGACRFVEIKAAGDVIRRNQLTRLQQLRTAGFNADVLQVSWTVDPNQTYVVVDVETTGGRPGLHRVTEIGAVKVKGGKVIDEWSSLINPQRSIPPNITRITGISADMVANAPVFGDVAESFAAFIGDAIFAAHNVNFDYGFIRAEFQMVDRQFSHTKICTCASMRKLYPGHASYSLKNLCRDFDIGLENHHRALCDAKAAAELLLLINEKRVESER